MMPVLYSERAVGRMQEQQTVVWTLMSGRQAGGPVSLGEISEP